jgi:hypothetical protein
MGPVTPDLELSHLIGVQLNQICIGPYDLQFRFGDSMIACQGKVLVEVEEGAVQVFDGNEWGDTRVLTKVAGRDACAWAIEASHEFSVSLAGGAKLRFVSTDCQYEEFVIHPQVWVV